MALSLGSTGAQNATQPMGEMNTTPLIDVMLVLLIMFIITIPVATHSVDIDLPGAPVNAPLNNLKNKIVIDAQNHIYWNGSAVSEGQMFSLLKDTLLLEVEPELQFEPDGKASYSASAKVLATIKASGITNFGFVGNEKHRTFGKSS